MEIIEKTFNALRLAQRSHKGRILECVIDPESRLELLRSDPYDNPYNELNNTMFGYNVIYKDWDEATHQDPYWVIKV